MTGALLIPVVMVLVVISKTGKLTNRFRNAGATNEENAKTLDELKMSRRFIFRKYLLYSIIIETRGKYYFNEHNLKNYRARKRMVLIPIIVVLIFFIYI